MMDSGIPPTNPNQPNSSAAEGPGGTQQEATGPFAKMFPGAPPSVIKKITNNFINFTINQMKQDQQAMLQALKQMQEDQDS